MTKRKRHRPAPVLVTRVFELDGEWYLVGDHDGEGFHAVLLTGEERELTERMHAENQIEMEAALTRRR